MQNINVVDLGTQLVHVKAVQAMLAYATVLIWITGFCFLTSDL